ncbi:MAG TPA: DUF1800 domain-containing protein [Armatimonadota bacterium]|jgi:uncharacterized protein (DUF1800 family)
MRHIAAILLAVACAAAPAAPSNRTVLTEDQRIRHALNRLAFGPRPGDVEAVRAMGLTAWIDAQLHPDTIPDAAVTDALSGLDTLQLPTGVLVRSYRDGVRQAAEAKRNDRNGAAPIPLMVGKDYRTFGARAVGELQLAKVYRAVESNRQLLEVMVDFWTNHFNIDMRKNADRALKIIDDREVVRPYALGRFRDLLGASAHSPAMLVYLDNARSSASGARGGLNENYAREIMELHTLGVDGGYTQKDVTEVARCFTGWSLNASTGRFQFFPRRHDDGAKTVLGHRIEAGGGIQDGETVLNILAASPSTARHIAYQLCQRFIADAPPMSAVDRAAQAFRDSGGDIAVVVRSIVTGPEFRTPAAYRAKTKSPFEYAVSALRALDGHVVLPPHDDAGAPPPLRAFGPRSLPGQVAAMGEPLFQCQPPTGYGEDSARWMGAGALVARMNFAAALAAGGVTGTRIARPLVDAAGRSAYEALAGRILGGDVSGSTRDAAVAKDAENPQATIAALLLGSPEFQRR